MLIILSKTHFCECVQKHICDLVSLKLNDPGHPKVGLKVMSGIVRIAIIVISI